MEGGNAPKMDIRQEKTEMLDYLSQFGAIDLNAGQI